ncbi:MAG: Sua5/YciO/YrdC/YwlC family protein [Burkholderiaceae bacterium]
MTRAAGAATRPGEAARAVRILVAGRVQGVGFRPFVHALATRLEIGGWVRNVDSRVEIEARGQDGALAELVDALVRAPPPGAMPRIERVEQLARAARGDGRERDGGRAPFEILASVRGEPGDAHLPPDRSLCADCLRELFDPGDRRHRHPFINCAHCGPRYTVIRALPYDRAATSMAGFAMCAQCHAEYEDPADRRFHAEPLSCPACGPRLRFESVALGSAATSPLPACPGGRSERTTDEAVLAAAVAALRAGKIVALEGVGGYHLLCDARNEPAVLRLRARKGRPDKPLAVMFPLAGADGLDALRAELSPAGPEVRALLDPARPIVLCARRPDSTLAPAIAPRLDEVGAMLPYSPCMRCCAPTSPPAGRDLGKSLASRPHRSSRGRATAGRHRRCLRSSRSADSAPGRRPGAAPDRRPDAPDPHRTRRRAMRTELALAAGRAAARAGGSPSSRWRSASVPARW